MKKLSPLHQRLQHRAIQRAKGVPVGRSPVALASKSVFMQASTSTRNRPYQSTRYEDPKLKADKGHKGGSCNITRCQEPGAVYFNKSTQAYYCAHCAEEINWPGGRADCRALYGTDFLCELDPEALKIVMGDDTDPANALEWVTLSDYRVMRAAA